MAEMYAPRYEDKAQKIKDQSTFFNGRSKALTFDDYILISFHGRDDDGRLHCSG